ncbi:MAG: alpha-galactosidase [Chitinophagaceae bacterium]|nr:MAG: alpha-galactosidase [Chitinophagaceae bacterium]
MIKKLFLSLLILPCIAQAQEKMSAKFLSALKASPAAVILQDGSKANVKEVVVTRHWNKELCDMSVQNISGQPLKIREVVVFDWQHHLPGSTPIYGEGFQMLSQTGGTLASPKDLGGYTDRGHYKIPEPEGLRTVYGMLMLQLSAHDRVLLATTSCNKFISRFSFNAQRMRISMDCENLTLKPGQKWNLEEFMAIAGPDREKLYDRLTAAIAKNYPRTHKITEPMGWSSWATFGPNVTAKDVAENADWIAKNMPQLKYIQIDDGYQPWMGDWLDKGKSFGGDLSQVLRQIKSKGLQPAIWVAPFIASPQSRLFKEHPDWMVKDKDGQPLRSDKVGFGGWRLGPWYVLDGTNPAVQNYLTQLFRTMRKKWGCTYFKLDALYWGAIQDGVHYDTNATSIEAYRKGMEAIRKGAGDAFLLGCNHPIWPSLGLIDGSRSSNDVDYSWQSFKTVGRESLLRGWQNGRFWWNDPDCILLNSPRKGDKPTENEYLFHATVIYATGGMLLSGDDLTRLPADKVAILKKLIPPTGMAARFENENFEIGITPTSKGNVYSIFNWGDIPAERIIKLPPGKYKLTNKWTGKNLGVFSSRYVIQSLQPHSAMLIEAEKVE